MNQRSFRFRGLALLLALVVSQPAWAATPTVAPQLPDPGSVGISKQEQEQVGRQAMGEVYKQMPVLPDSSSETQYIRHLGKRLADVIPRENSWPFEFHVIPQKEINAFALPGGPMFVNIGAIVQADNEAQLAGVMAHEMAHVYLQHSAKQASKAQWTGLLGALGGLLGGGTAGSLARLGIQLGAGTLMMRYSRADESQADAVGAIIMHKAGYDPRALAEFFQKLEQQGGGGGPQFLSDHPNPGNRQVAIDKEVSSWPPKNYLRNSQAFLHAKQDASAVKTYTGEQIAAGAKQGVWAQQNRQTGVIPANVPTTSNQAAGGNRENVSFPQIRPTGKMKQLQHSAFSISYPENWQASGDQQSTVAIAPQAGVGQGAIAYGVVIGGTRDSNATSLDQATADLVQTLQQSNPGLQVSGNMQNIEVNWLQARSVNLSGASPIQQNAQTLRERDWLVTVARPQGGLLYLVFIAPDKDFSQLQSTYERMLNSLQVQ
ncbi:MAG: M48 family metallopeptidase [Acidobacteriota bacterium]|nr:M48 family metallopeptidase [Acidobacteriota bacterium]